MSCRWFPSSRLWIQVRCKQHAWPLPRYKVHLKRTDRHLEHHHGATNFRSKRNIRYGYFRYGSNHLGENLSFWKRHYQEPDWNPFLGLWTGRTFKLFCQKISTTVGIKNQEFENWTFWRLDYSIRKPDKMTSFQMFLFCVTAKQTSANNSTPPGYSKNIWYWAIIWGRIVAQYSTWGRVPVF